MKIVTGGRRCGKSYLLFNVFHNYLINKGVDEKHIIEMSLDDIRNRKYRNPELLIDYIDNLISEADMRYYVILDEVQLVEDFVDVLLSLKHS